MICDTQKKEVFIIFVIFIVTFIDISTSKIIHNIYKLAKINDTYDDYQWTASGKFKNSYQYEKMFNQELFFEIMYNIKALRIPKITDVAFNYDTYSRNHDNYCKDQYLGYENHYKIKLLNDFKHAVTTLNNCLNNNQKNTKNDQQNTNFTLKHNLEKCLGLNSTGCNLCGLIKFESIKNSVKKNRKIKCLIKSLTDVQKTDLQHCMNDFHLIFPEIDEKITNNMSRKADTNTSKPSDDEKLEKLPPRDLNLLKDIIRKRIELPDNKTLDSLFENYTRLSTVIDANKHKEECDYYKMNMRVYTATQMMYEILPSSTDNFGSFKDKMNRVVTYLKNINNSDKNRNLYNNLDGKNGGYIDETHFKKLKSSRRAMEHESEYIIYAMRLLMKGYMPLTRNLWKEERMNLSNYQVDIDLEEKNIEL